MLHCSSSNSRVRVWRMDGACRARHSQPTPFLLLQPTCERIEDRLKMSRSYFVSFSSTHSAVFGQDCRVCYNSIITFLEYVTIYRLVNLITTDNQLFYSKRYWNKHPYMKCMCGIRVSQWTAPGAEIPNRVDSSV